MWRRDISFSSVLPTLASSFVRWWRRRPQLLHPRCEETGWIDTNVELSSVHTHHVSLCCFFSTNRLFSQLAWRRCQRVPDAIRARAWTGKLWEPRPPPCTSLSPRWWRGRPWTELFWSLFLHRRSLPWRWPCLSVKTKQRVERGSVLLIGNECASRC